MPKGEGIPTDAFSVQIDGTTLDGVLAVKLPRDLTEVMESGGQFFPKATHYGDLEIVRLADRDNPDLAEWIEEIPGEKYEKDVQVTLAGPAGKIEWTFIDAFPRWYDPPDLDSEEGTPAIEAAGIVFHDSGVNHSV